MSHSIEKIGAELKEAVKIRDISLIVGLLSMLVSGGILTYYHTSKEYSVPSNENIESWIVVILGIIALLSLLEFEAKESEIEDIKHRLELVSHILEIPIEEKLSDHSSEVKQIEKPRNPRVISFQYPARQTRS